MFLSPRLVSEPETVSYTHLDVYKSQVSGKKGALGGTWEPAIIDPGLYTMTDIAADFSLHAAERDNIAGFLPE